MVSLIAICSVICSSLFLTGVTGQTVPCRFGSGCLYPCECPWDYCDRTTGACRPGYRCRLEDPWTAGIRRSGPGCIIGNVARGKPTRQRGQWRDSHSGLAVDGSLSTDITQCAHPSAGAGNRAWWYVDLEDSYTVIRVTIYNRRERPAHRRTGDFRLGVGSVTDGDQTGLCKLYTAIVPGGGKDTITCDSPITGRFVTIIKNVGSFEPEFLGLCEVMVHGFKHVDCDENYYGTYCDNECSTTCQSNTGSRPCSQTSGRCSHGCQYPYYGDRCLQTCSGGCHVVDSTNTCDRDTGDCNHGCKPGFYTATCTARCSEQCKDQTCRSTDGYCVNGCTGAFRGDRCDVRCHSNCRQDNGLEVCSRESGNCTQGCIGPHYGSHCQYTCSGGCRALTDSNTCDRDTGTCTNGCQDGKHGDLCTLNCSQNCKPRQENMAGACTQSSGLCTDGCQDGWYGDYCLKPCPSQCSGKDGVPVCDRQSGSCTCQNGYYGSHCELGCSSHCNTDGTQTCHMTSGVCYIGCELPPYETWYDGSHCNQTIDYVELEESSYLNVTKRTSDTIMVEWYGAEKFPPNHAGIFRYIILVFEVTANGNTSRERQTRPFDSSRKYSYTLTNLSANTTYMITVGVYRMLQSKTEVSNYTRAISVTTLTQDAAGSPTALGGPVGPIVGSVVGFLVITALVVILAVVFLRMRRQRKTSSDDDGVNLEDIPSYTAVKKPTRQVEKVKTKEQDNPSFEASTEASSEDKVYYGFPATKTLGEGTCIKVEDLEVYVGAKKYTKSGLKKEYDDIPRGELQPCDVAKEKGNIDKNRFKNIKAYDCTRVVLKAESVDSTSDYINANFIKGYPSKEKHYVATQGPKPETTRAFWSMIWQLKINRIVMATQIKELQKTKCDQYWPEKVGEEMVFGNVTVTTTTCDSYADYNLTIITLKKSDEQRTLKHLQFLSWPDKQAPDHAFPLLAFRRKFRSFDKEGTGPIIIHCSAGVGRTGTLIALDYLLDQMKKEGQLDVASLVTKLRHERMNMVQTLPQYVFLYEALLEAYQQGETAIPCNVYPDRYHQLLDGNEYSNEVPIDDQLKALTKLKRHRESDDKPNALSKENINKNRDPDIVPDNVHGLFLSTKCPGTNNYVNAVFVNSFLCEKTFVVTQLPLPDTVVDFWRLVYDHNCHTVVTIQSPSNDEEDCPRYWAMEKRDITKFGNLEVEMESIEEDNEKEAIEERTFTVSYSSSFQTQSVGVRHVLFKYWTDNQSLPSKEDTLNLLERLQKWQQQGDGGKVIIQCKDGARCSGLICAAHYMLEKMKADSEVDVFVAVRAVSLHRPQFVTDLDQYRFLHEVAKEYIVRNDLYGNFK